VLVEYDCNPSHSGSRDQKIPSLKLIPRQIVHETLSQKKNPSHKRTDGVAPDVGSEVQNPSSEKQKQTNKKLILSISQVYLKLKEEAGVEQ
jgi:hypothetical protein